MEDECLLERIEALRELDDGWNSYDALKPKACHIDAAREWALELFYRAVTAWKLPWLEPDFVTGTAEGGVCLEWIKAGDCGSRLSVWFEDDGVNYLQSWGASMHREMADGDASHVAALRDVWEWLVG